VKQPFFGAPFLCKLVAQSLRFFLSSGDICSVAGGGAEAAFDAAEVDASGLVVSSGAAETA
jgi:hypothetical protein